MAQVKPARMTWAGRVPAHDIRRLYESDARGMLDEELLDEVGHGIYVRCQDILEISQAQQGSVKCRACGNLIQRRQGKQVRHPHGIITLEGGEAELLRCERCAWQVTWGDYRRSTRGRRLDELGVEHLLESFVRAWPGAHSPGEKLLLIDKLIHEFHVAADERGCPLGVNVIAGTAMEIYALLRDLAYGPGSTPAVQQGKQQWFVNARHLEYSNAELQTIARELGIRGASGMRKADLIAAIELVDPQRVKARS